MDKHKLKLMIGINKIDPFKAELLFPRPEVRSKDGSSGIVTSLPA
jgi:hypothetical protein